MIFEVNKVVVFFFDFLFFRNNLYTILYNPTKLLWLKDLVKVIS